MFGLLLLLFIIVPIAELYVIVQVAGGLGIWPTLGLLIADSLFGAWLVKREGISAFARARKQLNAAKLPTEAVVDGFLIMLAGAVLLTPGFITDVLGFLLLIPPSRAVVRKALIKRYKGRLEASVAQSAGPIGGAFIRGGRGSVVDADVVDVEVVDDWPNDSPPRDELGR